MFYGVIRMDYQMKAYILISLLLLIALAAALMVMYSALKKRNDMLSRRIDRLLSEKAERLEHGTNSRFSSLNRRVDLLSDTYSRSMSSFYDQMARVNSGIGDIRAMAGDLGDIKKIMVNPRARGAWGEVELRSIISETLAPGQYLENTPVVPGAAERVEFAIRMPGENGALLAVDSKFPTEDYLRIEEDSSGAFYRAVMTEARRISGKYVKPPHTVDYAVMFLPAESIYAEACRTPGLLEACRTRYRVLVSGPATFSALLTSLRMGYRGLEIEKRGEEVMRLLAGAKEEFSKYHAQAAQALTRARQLENELSGLEKQAGAVLRSLRDIGDM